MNDNGDGTYSGRERGRRGDKNSLKLSSDLALHLTD